MEARIPKTITKGKLQGARCWNLLPAGDLSENPARISAIIFRFQFSIARLCRRSRHRISGSSSLWLNIFNNLLLQSIFFADHYRRFFLCNNKKLSDIQSYHRHSINSNQSLPKSSNLCQPPWQKENYVHAKFQPKFSAKIRELFYSKYHINHLKK